MRRTTWTSLALLASLAAGCTFGPFTDMEERAPAVRLSPSGGIKSGNFGDVVVGIEQPEGMTGGTVFIGGNGDAQLATGNLSSAGESTLAQIEYSTIKDEYFSPRHIYALAQAPSLDEPSKSFAYMTADSGLFVVKIDSFQKLGKLSGPSTPSGYTDFGLGLARMHWGAVEGLAVGADGGVVLMTSSASSWPGGNLADPRCVLAGTSWPAGRYTVMVAGDLGGATDDGDELVAGAPNKNTVVLVYGAKKCVDNSSSSCTTFFRLVQPSASGFGAALLIADVDGDQKNELVVGAPESGKVFVFKIDLASSPTGEQTLTPALTLTPKDPADVGSFGVALAFGRFAGGDKDYLAVGAPSTSVGGQSSAGKIFLFDQSGAQVGEGISLVTPEAGAQLGQRLALMPFRTKNGLSSVLAAGGRDAVFLFFSNLTTSHKDVRVR